MIWNFYFSGILYGKISEGNDELQIALLDPAKGVLKAPVSFTEQEDQFLMKLCSRSILSFFQNKREYEMQISANPLEFTTTNGEHFTCRRGESYYQRNQKFPKDLFFEGNHIYAVLMSGRDFCAVLVREGWENRTILSEWTAVQTGSIHPVTGPYTYQVLTRDGEQLATDVYLPLTDLETAFPTVLVRTPYGKSRGIELYYRFVQRGYAVVIQDTRGREDSTGEWIPEYYEVEDGDDTLNWIAAQSWSNGKVSMTGGSYLGYVQWAAAASGNPHLKAILSSVCAGSAFVDIPRRGGCFNSGMLAWGFAMSEQHMRPDLMVQENWDAILDIRPLKDIPQKALGHNVPFLSRWLEHKDLDAFWHRSNWKERYQGNPVPALILSGWFDDNGMGTTEALELVQNWPKGTWKAILGPWKHSGNADYDLQGLPMGEDALRYDIDLICFQWLEHFLKDVDNHIEQGSAVEYFTLHDNCWKTAENWPVTAAQPMRFYLTGTHQNSGVGCSEQCGSGILSRTAPSENGSDTYYYDPDHPSLHLVDVSENELEVPADYQMEERRCDVLSYSTPILEKPLTVTGEIQVTLFISCDCPDTDFVIRINDVDEEGHSYKLADGVLSAKYRNSFTKPDYLEPGTIYPVKLRSTKISNTFAAGHRMRLTVTSSAKNFIFPNSNTRDAFDSVTKQTATITIHRGGSFSSYLDMPVETI